MSDILPEVARIEALMRGIDRQKAEIAETSRRIREAREALARLRGNPLPRAARVPASPVDQERG